MAAVLVWFENSYYKEKAMKKITMNFISILALILVMCSALIAYQKVKYQSGRDTVVSFGDGTYQILRAPIPPAQSGSKPTFVYSLCNLDTDSDIEDNVIEYLQIKHDIFAFGEKGYTVLNYKTGEITQEKELKDMPEKYQEISKKKNAFTKLRK